MVSISPEITSVRTMSLLLIGAELLRGKITDANGPLVIEEARSAGVALREITMIDDDLLGIATSVRRMAADVDLLVTSGGVGPTHDDLTLPAVAQAFDEDLYEHPDLRDRISAYYASRPEQLSVWLRMARVPVSTRLVMDEGMLWPVYQVRNVYVLPGVPEIFRRQFVAASNRFHRSASDMQTLYVTLSEGEIAEHLEAVLASYPSVEIGSYPVFGRNTSFRTRITLEDADPPTLERALAALTTRLPPASIVRVTRGKAPLVEW